MSWRREIKKMKTKKEVKDYLMSIEEEYDYQSSEAADEATEEEMKIMEISIETLEWVLK